MAARDFTELAAWQLAHELRLLIVAVTERSPARRDLRFCDQCKDAARSATSNIAEGFGRYRHRDFARFLRIATGSLHEVRDHLIDGHARGYVTDDELARGTRLSKRAAGATGDLIRYLMNHPDAPE
jgi:four helix bundle protein